VTKRKRYLAEFKAKVGLEAIREELPTAELAKKYDVHLTIICGWRRTAIENMASAFGGDASAEPAISENDVEKLHTKIGQLVAERPCCANAAGDSLRESSMIAGGHEQTGENPVQDHQLA
tara:strand:- start:128 stop:487 length:360 start_codon:yes stop_codon:yes gene_type:complete